MTLLATDDRNADQVAYWNIADERRVRDILDRAGFGEVSFEAIELSLDISRAHAACACAGGYLLSALSRSSTGKHHSGKWRHVSALTNTFPSCRLERALRSGLEQFACIVRCGATALLRRPPDRQGRRATSAGQASAVSQMGLTTLPAWGGVKLDASGTARPRTTLSGRSCARSATKRLGPPSG